MVSSDYVEVSVEGGPLDGSSFLVNKNNMKDHTHCHTTINTDKSITYYMYSLDNDILKLVDVKTI